MPLPTSHALRPLEATTVLDRIMELKRQSFAVVHQELRETYAQRIATFPQGSLMAWVRRC